MGRRFCLGICLFLPLFVVPSLVTAGERPADLVQAVRPFAAVISGRESAFTLTGTGSIPIDGRPQPVELRLVRYDSESFDLELTHPEYAIRMSRRPESTLVVLPKHRTAFAGRGEVPESDRLSPTGLLPRLISSSSALTTGTFVVNLLSGGNLDDVLRFFAAQAKVDTQLNDGVWKSGDVQLSFPESGRVDVVMNDVTVSLTVSMTAPAISAAVVPDDYKLTELTREELERTFVRGVRRATEILQPGPQLITPEQSVRTHEHGMLQWIDGQRVVTLWGTPEEIGTAHGKLLPEESRRCMESVLYSFGMANVIRTGRWFRHDLLDAFARLSPHIPERHRRETRALAAALNMDAQTVEVLNVFPELFHCSGFAVFGSATVDGKLYHGRVLDYMTTIGLQDSCTTFIVRPEGMIPFANVGYAAFIGSVSGMNAEQISLGEMGGRGEGLWDGAPMATLMRRALEECDSLEEVQELWRTSPRTCEYYYVFADGETNSAVGVAATPEAIEFIKPGQAHDRLGEGIPDTVVLSAGSRLTELRRRVQEQHGKLNTELGQWLMSRPVAMESNLHNVLFVPADGVLYVANASHTKPAAETPYVKIDLRALLTAGESRVTEK
ncbi:MAG: C45 family autoproteolytic acyltransferase/hydrolase [Planctomycetota bacterium]